MPDFDESGNLILLAQDRNIPLSFTFEAASTETANDGSIPFGTTISSAEVIAYRKAGTDVTDDMVTQAAAVEGLTVSCEISSFDEIVAGTYILRVILTLDTGTVKAYRLARIKAL